MRMQDTAANCGPAALSNALDAMGIKRSQDECAALCKTTATEGTSPKKLLAAITAVGRKGIVIKERRTSVALAFLEGALSRGRSVVLCVDNDSHWVAAVGLLGDRVLVADSADNDLVLSYDLAGLAKRWGEGRYYGIAL